MFNTRTSMLRLASATLIACSVNAAAFAQATIFAWDPGSPFRVDPALPEAPTTGARFGFAVAMSNQYAVIGAPDVRLIDRRFPNAGSNGAGAAFVFKRTAGTNDWTFIQRLIAPTRELSQTGCSVAIDSQTNDIIVGAWASNTVTGFGGAAFIYKKSGGDSWGESANAAAFGTLSRIPTQTLAPEELQPIDQFGFSVAIDSGTVAVGCPLAGTSNTGSIYTYTADGDGVYQFTHLLTDDTAGANDQIGTKLALSGNLLVAGAQNDDVSGRINAGSALVFRRSGGEWTAGARIKPATPTASAQFGSSVAVYDGDEDWIVVGAPLQASGRTTPVSGNGAAYIFRSTDAGISWTLNGTLLPRTDNINNNFGYSVALSQTEPPQILVGAPGYDTAKLNVDDPTRFVQILNGGTGFTFTQVAGAWALRGGGDQWSPNIIANSCIGRAVALAPSQLSFSIVGAETPTSSLGSAYPFEFRSGTIGAGSTNVSGPAPGVLDENGLPSDGTTPGTGSGGTGGTIPGGGGPAGGITSGPGSVTIPLTPIVLSWGTIKGSAVALNGKKISLLQTDGKHAANQPSFKRLGELPAGSRFVGTGDMNGDLSGDIVFVDSLEVVRYWKRDGFRILSTNTIDTLPVGFDAIAVVDIDADSKDDIILRGILDPSLISVWHIAEGAIASADDYELPSGDWTIFTGNFRTKNNTDLLIRERTTGEIRVFEDVDGDAEFTTITRHTPRDRVAGFADTDGDGQPDIIWQGKEITIETIDQDDAGNYIRKGSRRVGFANATIVNVRDWNDDGTVDFWMSRGKRNYIQYGRLTNGYMYGDGSRDLGNSPGRIVGISKR